MSLRLCNWRIQSQHLSLLLTSRPLSVGEYIIIDTDEGKILGLG